MKPITTSEIISLQHTAQHFCDCYLLSSIGALARNKRGQKILTQNIAHADDGFRIRFAKIDNQQKDYFVSKENLEAHPKKNYIDTVIERFQDSNTNKEKVQRIYSSPVSERQSLLNEYFNELLEKYKPNTIINAIEIAMNKLLKEHPKQKPLISRLITFHNDEKFEYNYPSYFLEMFTGEKPLILNERSLRMTLKKDTEKAIELFENIDKSDDFSMVAGTGLFTESELLQPIHCYTVEGVNSENQYIQIFNYRKLESIKLTFDEAIKSLKYLTGYLH